MNELPILNGAAAVLLALAASCGAADAEKASGVTHLSPRLADGRSPTQALLETADTWIDETLFETETDGGSWELLYAEVTPEPSGGLRLSNSGRRKFRDREIELTWKGSLRAEEVNLIELEIEAEEAGAAQLRWQSENLRNQIARMNVQVPGPGRHRIRFAPGNLEHWFGELTNLRIAPGHTGNREFVLHAVRVGRTAISLGVSRLEGDGSDAGLLELNGTSLRAWPTDWDVPLYELASVPPGGRLAVGFAAPRITAERAHFLLDARVPDGVWENVARKSFEPERVALLHSWQYLTAGLERWSGQQVELRLRATLELDGEQDLEAGTQGTLREAHVLWGAPLLNGTLAPDRAPNLVLITLDTLRADAVGAYNPGQGRTPFLDRMAAQGIVFENAWSACNATSPSHASLLTGLAVQDHGVVNNRSILAPEITTLAEVLREAGYHTVAAVSAGHLDAGRSGMGQGFDQFFSARDGAARDGSITTHVVKDWLAKWSGLGERPLFLWLHLFDPHTPYGPPESFARTYADRYGESLPEAIDDARAIPATFLQDPGRFLEGVNNPEYARYLYRAGVAYVDELVRDFYDELAQRVPIEETAFVFTSDHGESLGENDIWFDHIGLYRDVLKVPLILKLPDEQPARVPDLVSSLDVPVTLLSLAGLEPLPRFRGMDLLPLLHGETEAGSAGERRVWFEHVNTHQLGCRDDQFHFIQTLVQTNLGGAHALLRPGTRQIFDHAADSALSADLAEARPELADEYRSRLESWRESALKIRTIEGDLTVEEASELKALGYTSGGSED